jgi:hypothetical protein
MSKLTHSYSIYLPGALLMRVEAPVPVFDEESARILAEAYLPGADFVGVHSRNGALHVCTKEPTITVRFVESTATSLTVQAGNYTLADAWNGEASLMDLLFLCYGAARRAWLKRGLYPVHAAALSMGDGGLTLLVGHSGSGKTALTLSAVARGHKVFSGNKTLVRIDGQGDRTVLTAVAGTRPMTTKAEDVARHLDLGKFNTGYQGRSAFYLAKEHYAATAPSVVTGIVLPRLNDGVTKRKFMGPVSALHKLYPYFMDAVNADIVLAGGKCVLSGEPRPRVRELLAAGLGAALSGDELSSGMSAALSVVEVEGSLEFVNATLDGKR